MQPRMVPFGGKTPVRVARIIARLNIGGPAIQSILLTEGLAGAEFTPILVTGLVGDTEGDMMFYAHEKKVDPVVIPELGREISWKNDIAALWKLVQLLRKLRPHIVHTHTAKAGLLGRLAALVTGVPIRVHTFHGHIFQGYFGPLKTKLFILMERCLARITHCIIAISQGQRDELTNKYRIADKSKFRVIPLGFDLGPFVGPKPVGAMRAELGIPHDAFTVGFIGRLVPVKNPFLLIEATDQVKRCLAKDSDSSSRTLAHLLRVIIVGGGELYEPLGRTIKARGLDAEVVCLGWRRDMAAVYADLDIVVLTSINEGTPVALIEAMASGKPFVATDVGGVRDLLCGAGRAVFSRSGGQFTVYENGIVVSPQDVEGMAAALIYALEHKEERTKMGHTGQRLALQRFGKERLLEDIRALYEESLHAKGIDRVPA